MANINDTYKSTSALLSAEDLQGKKITLPISAAAVEEIGQGDDKDHKVVLSFKGAEKKLALNKTNAKTIAAGYGDETDNWIGEDLCLYPTTTEFQGKTVPCVRVEIPVEAAEAGSISI